MIISLKTVAQNDTSVNNLYFGINANTTRQAFAKEMGKHLEILNIPINGSSARFWEKADKKKEWKFYYEMADDACAIGTFLGKKDWVLQIRTSQDNLSYGEKDTVCTAQLYNTFETDSISAIYFKKAQQYIEQNYLYRVKIIYDDETVFSKITQIDYFTPNGIIYLKNKNKAVYIEYEDEQNSDYAFTHKINNDRKENKSYRYEIQNMMDQFVDKKLIVTENADKKAIFFHAGLNNMNFMMEARDQDYDLYRQLSESLSDKTLKEILRLYMKPYIEHQPEKHHVAVTHNILCKSFYYHLQQDEEKRQKKQKEQEIEKAKTEYLYNVVKTALNLFGSQMRNTPTIWDQYYNRPAGGY